MSWAYWGIVIGLVAMIVMLIACIRLLSSDDNEAQRSSEQGAGGSVDMNQEPPMIHRRAA
ncbi:MAG: hypothetical protein A4E19_12965 [Nitrospira sp. SG-bin1]|nr:MAG: hypothetical protein A4E19_12965 [Nitrospira sp. SG-bin1]